MKDTGIENLEVRRKVYEVGRHIEAASELAGVEAVFYMAEMMRDWYRERKMKKKAAFWQEVTDYLKMVEFSGAKVKVIILPD